jgi:cytochrome c551/c552
MYAYNLQFNFYIGDGIEGVKFETTSVTAKGVGKSEQRAYLMAFNEIDVSSDQFKNFVENGKKKIIEYYNSKCDFILKEAQTLAGQAKYDAAIGKLFTVPEVCKSCYDKAMDAVGPIFKQQIDRQCKLDMAEANAKWTANQDAYGAEAAAAYLAKIDPNSSCYAEAKVLNDKMAKRVKEIDQREWNFALKQQQDQVDIEKATIKAARDIGVAYGENQPDVIYETAIYGWW